MIDDILLEAEEKMDKAVEAASHEFFEHSYRARDVFDVRAASGGLLRRSDADAAAC